MRPSLALACLMSLSPLACSSDEQGPSGSTDDGGGEDSGGDPGLVVGRHEPSERIDFDNVVNYGPEPTLDLPDPPKSGFRIVVPPRMLEAGAEVEACHAWSYPDIRHKNVYAARVYTSGGLHHSNVYGVPLSAEGPSPYPGCVPGQSSVVLQVPNLLSGNIMDVLFANSTQIDGGEAVVFPEGMAFQVTTDGREIATSIHWVNPSAETLESEVVYDFFTMPDDLVTTEVVPFVFENQAIAIPPRDTGEVVATCDLVPGANVVSFMPHAHSRTTEFVVDLIDAEGEKTRVFEDIGFDAESDIHVFEEPLSLAGFSKIEHRCSVDNDTDEEIVYGVGNNEMCTLFGYLYPPQAQQLGYVAEGSTSCLSLDLGMHRQ